MNCEQVQSKLLDYIDCQLAPGGADAITSHLQSCERCKTQFGNWQDTLEEIQKAKELVYCLPKAISIKSHVIAQVAAYEQHKRLHRRSMKIWNRLAVIAATLALLFTGYAGYQDYQDQAVQMPIAFEEDMMANTFAKKEDLVRISSSEELLQANERGATLEHIVHYSLGGIFGVVAVGAMAMKKRTAKQLENDFE